VSMPRFVCNRRSYRWTRCCDLVQRLCHKLADMPAGNALKTQKALTV